MEIMFKFDESSSKLTVQARRKFVKNDHTRLDDCNGDELIYWMPVWWDKQDCGTTLILDDDDDYGVRSGEWYQLAVRWYDGVNMDFGTEEALVVSGNFYDISDDIANRGPATGATYLTGYFDYPNGVAAAFPNRDYSDVTALTRPEYSAAYEPLQLLRETSDPDVATTPARRMYFGCVKRENSVGTTVIHGLPMTIDDIRIATDTSWYTDFMPTRYPWINQGTLSSPSDDGQIEYVAEFKGKFANPSSTLGVADDLLGGFYYTIRKWESDNLQCDITDDPPSADIGDDEFDYSVAFYQGYQENISTIYPFYQAPILDDITIGYHGVPTIYEYARLDLLEIE